MIVEKIFSEQDTDERLYSVLMDEDEVALFSEFQERLYGRFAPNANKFLQGYWKGGNKKINKKATKEFLLKTGEEALEGKYGWLDAARLSRDINGVSKEPLYIDNLTNAVSIKNGRNLLDKLDPLKSKARWIDKNVDRSYFDDFRKTKLKDFKEFKSTNGFNNNSKPKDIIKSGAGQDFLNWNNTH